MKTPYIYFGTKGYWYEADATGDQFINGASATALVQGTAGMVPEGHTAGLANTSTSTDAYRIVIQAAADTASNERGSNYTTDFVTGLPLTGVSGTLAHPKQGETVSLNAAGWGVGSGGNVGKIEIVAYTDAANGYDLQNNDKVWVEQVARKDAAGNGRSGGELSQAFCYPMTSFMGADPSATPVNYIHYDGTELQQTDLRFKNLTGGGNVNVMRIIHTKGKFPEICKTMEAIANCGIYDRAVTFYDLDFNGVETFAGGSTLSGHNDLGIVGCWQV